jgi:hypothetical protein
MTNALNSLFGLSFSLSGSKIKAFFLTSSKRDNTPSLTILGACELCFDKKSKISLK